MRRGKLPPPLSSLSLMSETDEKYQRDKHDRANNDASYISTGQMSARIVVVKTRRCPRRQLWWNATGLRVQPRSWATQLSRWLVKYVVGGQDFVIRDLKVNAQDGPGLPHCEVVGLGGVSSGPPVLCAVIGKRRTRIIHAALRPWWWPIVGLFDSTTVASERDCLHVWRSLRTGTEIVPALFRQIGIPL